MARNVEEPFVRVRGGPVVAVEARSTILISAINSLRARGLGERYETLLSPSARERLLRLTTGLWVPVELALSHYDAADRLGLDTATIESIGAEVGERVYKSVFGVLVKLSRDAGVGPWNMLASAHRINELSWRGTDIAVWKVGPKEARYDWVKQPCARIPYFAISAGSVLRTVIGLLCTKAYSQLLPARSSATVLSYRLSWA